MAGAKDYLDLICDQSLSGMSVLRGTHEYSVKANWKLLVENSFDGYHAVSTHQRYFEMVMAARGKIDPSMLGDSRGIDLGNGHAVAAGAPVTEGLFGRPTSEDAMLERTQRFDRLRAAHGDAWVDRMAGARNLLIFPNLVVIDLVMGVVIRKIDPITPDYMEVTGWELAPQDEGDELRRQRLDNFLTFWGPGGLASPDDVEALETCQWSYAGRREVPWSDVSRGMNKPYSLRIGRVADAHVLAALEPSDHRRSTPPREPGAVAGVVHRAADSAPIADPLLRIVLWNAVSPVQ